MRKKHVDMEMTGKSTLKKAPVWEFFWNRLPTFVFWIGYIGQKRQKTNKIKDEFDSWHYLLYFFYFYRYFDNIIIVNYFGHNNHVGILQQP